MMSALHHIVTIFLFIDVITIEKTGEHFRLLYDVKGRFCVHRITPEEARVSRYEPTSHVVLYVQF